MLGNGAGSKGEAPCPPVGIQCVRFRSLADNERRLRPPPPPLPPRTRPLITMALPATGGVWPLFHVTKPLGMFYLASGRARGIMTGIRHGPSKPM
jgi:hypothetical protein